jgi:predicted Zn-dependent protease with MMP-like domain
MVDIDRFYEMLNDVCEELPEDFFRELHYGVHLSEECKLSPYAENGDMVIMGEYHRSRQGNRITIYYGSFARTCGWMPEEELKDRLRKTVRHEFRHHMENLAGMYGADSLEHEDMEEIRDMVYAREERKNRNRG